MPDFIKFGGNTLSANGITIEKTPGLSRPARKIDVVSIPGRSGDLVYMQDAWENYEQAYDVVVNTSGNSDAPASIRALCNGLYLNGYQTLEDSFESDYFRLAYFAGPMDVENILNMYGRATISFNCRPERYLTGGSVPISINSGSTLNNPEKYASKPLIKVTGTSSGALTIQGQQLNITGMVDFLYIDCDTMDVYRLPAENRNSLMTGVFPKLLPGNNTITFTGFSAVEITPRFFTI